MTVAPDINIFSPSKYVLGRSNVRDVLYDTGSVVLSAYKCRRGVLHYNGPVNPGRPAKETVLYRIRVRLKE